MLEKNIRKRNAENKTLDQLVGYLLIALIVLGVFSWVFAKSGMSYFNYNRCCKEHKLICYNGMATDISESGRSGGRVSPSYTINITLDNQTVLCISSKPLHEINWLQDEIQYDHVYSWYYTEYSENGEHYLVSIADQGLDEHMLQEVGKHIARQARIALSFASSMFLLWFGVFCYFIFVLAVQFGFETSKQKAKRLAEEKRKAARREKYLAEQERKNV